MKNILLAMLFGFLMIASAHNAVAQQSIGTLSGEVITIGGNSVSVIDDGSSTDGESCEADDVVVSSENAQAQPGTPRPKRPRGCLQMQCWMTCNVPGMGNTYESALKCGNQAGNMLRTSCTNAGGTVTQMSCRPMGYSGNPCSPAQYNPRPETGPAPF